MARLPAAARPPSEYAFANLFLFRSRHRYRIVAGPVPHVSGLTYDGRRHALPLAPLDPTTVSALLDGHDCLFPFGAEGIALAETFGLGCAAHDADSDYVYNAADMAVLAHAKTRRSQARAFEAEHAPRYQDVTPDMTAALGAILDGWLSDVGRDADATDVVECREAIALAGALGLTGGLVRTGSGEPVAFMLVSRRDDGEHLVHFAKGRRAHSGAYPWMFARYAASSGATRLNFEQDLGNPGFAQSKRSYAPVERRPKYRLFGPRP